VNEPILASVDGTHGAGEILTAPQRAPHAPHVRSTQVDL